MRYVLGLMLMLLLALPPGALASSGSVTLVPERTDVLEVLRLKVPASARACWREAEASTWEPWLGKQPGYRGRELYWDPERQEGLLLIGWAQRSDWDQIPSSDIETVQQRFEAAAQGCLGSKEMPFPLLSSGELLHEKLELAGLKEEP